MERRIKRRHLMAGGTAAVASRYLSRAAAALFDPAAPAWVLSYGSSRYVVRVRGASVLLDCYAADDEAGPAEGEPAAGSAMILAGPERRPVAWRVATWHQPDPLTLRLLVSAIYLPLGAEIVFTIDRATGMLSRGTMLRHQGSGADVTIATTLAFCCAVHEPVERVLHLAGAWGHEAQVRHGLGDVPLHLETRSGKTGFEFQPYVALHTQRATWLCEILWCGNWSLDVAPSPDGATLAGGLNNWSFRHRMGVTGSLRLPTVLFGRFEGDLNAATRRLHDWRRAHQYLLTPAPPPDGNGDWAAIWYVAKDASAGALFAFRLAGGDASRTFPLPGLNAKGRYHARTFGGTNLQIGAGGLAVTAPEPFHSELVAVEQL